MCREKSRREVKWYIKVTILWQLIFKNINLGAPFELLISFVAVFFACHASMSSLRD